jgi:hypothetical protein
MRATVCSELKYDAPDAAVPGLKISETPFNVWCNRFEPLELLAPHREFKDGDAAAVATRMCKSSRRDLDQPDR